MCWISPSGCKHVDTFYLLIIMLKFSTLINKLVYRNHVCLDPTVVCMIGQSK